MIDGYWELLILLSLVNVIFAVSLNLVLGFNGQFSLGHAGFLAIGAYASGVATASYDLPLWAGMLLALLVSGVASVIIGYPCLRLRGDYLAIATLGFAEIIRIVLTTLPRDIFGGPTGMDNINNIKDYLSFPESFNGPGNLIFTVIFAMLLLGLLGFSAWTLSRLLAALLSRLLPWKHWRWLVLGLLAALLVWRFEKASNFFLGKFMFSQAFSPKAIASNQWAAFAACGLIVLLCLWLTRNYLASMHGRMAIAIREDEVAANNLGIDIAWMKLQNFIFASMLAGLAGALTAHTLPLIRPLGFGFFKSVEVLLMVVLGGMGSLTGSVFGAITITVLPELLRFLEQWRMVIYSLSLVLLMLFRPGGLMGTQEIGNLIRLRLFKAQERPGA
ncbi:branched-chain amino acid ABC transporter permease [bacterium]|nr:branched-chain amino acid ABC transporter permease [bacterium]